VTAIARKLLAYGCFALKARLSQEEAREILRCRFGRQERAGGKGNAQPERSTWRVCSQTYAPGDVIDLPSWGTHCPGLVIEGHVAAYRGPEAGGRLFLVLTPGRTFGPSAPGASRLAGTTLKALNRCEIWFLCPAEGGLTAGGRPARHGAPPVWYRPSVVAVWLAIGLIAMLILRLPSSRSALAAGPMALGEWCGQRDDSRCSEQAWKLASALAPEDPMPWLALGALNARRGTLDAAREAFEVARALAPDSPEAANNLGVVYARQNEIEAATNAFRQALALEPGVATVEHNLAVGLQAEGAYDEALTHYRSALNLSQDPAEILVDMAFTYLSLGQLDQAEEAARQALHSDTATAPALTLLGAEAIATGQPVEALRLLRRATEIDASYSPASLYLGLALLALHQAPDARIAFEQSLATAQDEAMREQIRGILAGLRQ
jgi:Flp pilus assembly protein TadD